MTNQASGLPSRSNSVRRRRVRVDRAAADDRQQQQRDADERSLEHAAGADVAQVEADQKRDRNRREHRRGRPRTVLHRVDDDESEHGDEDDHDHERADDRGEAADRAELIARHLSEAAAVAARRQEQDRHILHAAAEHGADQDPQRARQIAELRRERRADQRAWTCDRREVMAEDDPAMRRNEVAAVVQPNGRRRARRVDAAERAPRPMRCRSDSRSRTRRSRRRRSTSH